MNKISIDHEPQEPVFGQGDIFRFGASSNFYMLVKKNKDKTWTFVNLTSGHLWHREIDKSSKSYFNSKNADGVTLHEIAILLDKDAPQKIEHIISPITLIPEKRDQPWIKAY